jgi:hypothetical protein
MNTYLIDTKLKHIFNIRAEHLNAHWGLPKT